jgi:hypothetical protein
MSQMNIPFNVKASDGGVHGGDIQYTGILQLVPSATIPRIKIKICEHHLECLKGNLKNEIAVRAHLEIIFTFLRSATFSVQKICKHEKGFEEWWNKKREDMRSDEILLKVIDLRNITEKEGFELTDFGVKVITKVNRNGKVTNSIQPSNIIINGYTFDKVIDELSYSINNIKEIIEEAHKIGFVKENRKPNRFFHEIYKEDSSGNWKRIT